MNSEVVISLGKEEGKQRILLYCDLLEKLVQDSCVSLLPTKNSKIFGL